ncbi:MAG: PAS domain S-box protein [Desulfobulbaceae bacterium]|nr:PAS domain S-box protein [Desulfobulbaceae bacterium]
MQSRAGRHDRLFCGKIGMNGLLLIAEKSRNNVIDQIPSGYEKPYEAIGLRKNGEEYPIRLEARNVPYKGKSVRTVEFRDITEQKQAEEALRLTRFSIEHASDAVFWSTPDARIVDVNEAACRSLGYTRQELLQLSLPDVDPHCQTELWTKNLTELRLGGSPKFESEHIAKDGRLIPVEIVSNYVQFGVVERICDFVRDITDRKRAEEESAKLEVQLQQAQKMEAIGTLAGGIAHDFNNILGAVIGYAELIREGSSAGSETFQYVTQFLKAGTRAKELVRQILTFSHQADIDKIPLQPAPIIKEAVKMLRASLPATITIKQDIDPDAGIVMADPTQIHQIVMNLSTNAFHAMEMTGGTLTISLHKKTLTREDLDISPNMQQGKFVQLSIKDTGEGIAQEIRSKIFAPFFTTKEVGKGTGLGLSIVHGIVKSYGGSITCDSLLEEGTVF